MNQWEETCMTQKDICVCVNPPCRETLLYGEMDGGRNVSDVWGGVPSPPLRPSSIAKWMVQGLREGPPQTLPPAKWTQSRAAQRDQGPSPVGRAFHPPVIGVGNTARLHAW